MNLEKNRSQFEDGKRDVSSHEGVITLALPDGGVVQVRDGDVVGRTAGCLERL